MQRTRITVAEKQVEECKRLGLDVMQASFEDIRERFEPCSFDVVILNGPTEHFVTEIDALKGRTEEIRQALFDDIRYLLRPNGRVWECVRQKKYKCWYRNILTIRFKQNAR